VEIQDDSLTDFDKIPSNSDDIAADDLEDVLEAIKHDQVAYNHLLNDLSSRPSKSRKCKRNLFPCEICQKPFNRLSNMKRHIELIHEKHSSKITDKNNLTKDKNNSSSSQNNNNCEMCGKSFSNSTNLKVHQNVIHKGQKDHICILCNKAFGTQSDLKRHTKLIHKDDDQGPIRYKHEYYKGLLEKKDNFDNIDEEDNIIENEDNFETFEPQQYKSKSSKNKLGNKKKKYQKTKQ
jgi:stress-induced morphogen